MKINRIKLIILIISIITLGFIYFFNIVDDVKNTDTPSLLTGTDIVYSMKLDFDNINQAKQNPSVSYSWNDIFYTRKFKKNLTEIFDSTTLKSKFESIFHASFINFTMLEDFKPETFYIHWQFNSSKIPNPKNVFRKSAKLYCKYLKSLGINANATSKIIIRESDFRSLMFLIIIEKSIIASTVFLLLGMLILLVKKIFNDTNVKLNKNFIPFLFITIGILLFLIFGKQLFLISLLFYIAALITSIIFIYNSEFRHIAKKIHILTIFILLSSIIGLFFIRLDFYVTKPSFLKKYTKNMLFYQQIKLSNITSKTKKWEYSAFDLPKSTFFKKRLLEQEKKNIKKTELVSALKNYPFECEIFVGDGELLQEGKLFFTMRLQYERFFNKKKAHNKNLLKYLNKLFKYYREEYEKMLIQENIELKQLSPIKTMHNFPPIDTVPQKRAAVAFILFIAALFIIIQKWF